MWNLRRCAVVSLLTVGVLGVIPSPASAGGPSSTCSLNNYCINREAAPFGSSTTMTHGWLHYPGAATSGSVAITTSNNYSNSGGQVAAGVGSIRNRNNITGRIMCPTFFQGEGGPFAGYSASWYTQVWVNEGFANFVGFYWRNSSTTC